MERKFFFELLETGQLRVDELNHIVLFNEFGLLFPMGILIKLRDSLIKLIGTEKSDELFTQMGEFQVEAAAKRLVKTMGINELSVNKINELGINVMNTLGWGMLELTGFSYKEKNAEVNLKESSFALKYKQLYKEPSKKPIDFWVAGMLKKHFSLILDGQTNVEETSCIAMGDKTCSFRVYQKV